MGTHKIYFFSSWNYDYVSVNIDAVGRWSRGFFLSLISIWLFGNTCFVASNLLMWLFCWIKFHGFFIWKEKDTSYSFTGLSIWLLFVVIISIIFIMIITICYHFPSPFSLSKGLSFLFHPSLCLSLTHTLTHSLTVCVCSSFENIRFANQYSITSVFFIHLSQCDWKNICIIYSNI